MIYDVIVNILDFSINIIIIINTRKLFTLLKIIYYYNINYLQVEKYQQVFYL